MRLRECVHSFSFCSLDWIISTELASVLLVCFSDRLNMLQQLPIFHCNYCTVQFQISIQYFIICLFIDIPYLVRHHYYIFLYLFRHGFLQFFEHIQKTALKYLSSKSNILASLGLVSIDCFFSSIGTISVPLCVL